ncbi:5821_t:CDS:2 [Gigaspora margarita]|uniref:5821_t:CDS:1 n=1 Tax=Gigaspora margarita TaxID=4874 RepID=A0ABM8VXW4_GIGMA|nr:5821_t:CDS:2 [Gigaspora margarita]
MDPRHVENDNRSEHEEDRNQTPVNPPLLPPGQNGYLNQEPLYILNEPAVQILPQARNVNLCDLDDTGYYSEGEDAFVTPMARHQLPFIVKPNLPMEDIETNVAQLILNEWTIAARCYICIKNNPIVAVLDSGTAMSLMSKRIMNKLDLKIDEPSTTVVVTANGTRKRALGKIKNVKLAICDILIPTLFQVIEFSEDLLLLVIYLTYGNKTAEVPITTDSGSPIEVVEEPSESKRTFDKFEYEDEALEEAKGFFTEEISNDEIFWNP